MLKLVRPTLIVITMLVVWPMAVNASIIEYDFHLTGGTPAGFSPVLQVDSAVLATGLTFTMNCPLTPPFICTHTGDPTGFIGMTDSTLAGSKSFDLNFAANGTLAGSIVDNGTDENLSIAGSGFSWSGTLLSDHFSVCGVLSPCHPQGYWLRADLPVPEPSSLLVLIIGLLNLVVLVGCTELDRIRRATEPISSV